MIIARALGEAAGPPFPIYDDVVSRMLHAHSSSAAAGTDARDPTVAHLLACCAGYAYADVQTTAGVMARMGLAGNASVFIQQTVDAMYIYSTALLVQSACGRVVILCYRGTEVSNLGNWPGDADVGPEAVVTPNGKSLQVHSGFYRNVRATRSIVLQELARALAGRSLIDPARSVEHPMQALYVTGHSLGGAMALLFAQLLAASEEHHEIAACLSAVYTFGQPMALLEPVPPLAREVGRAVYRHILPRDMVPALPPVQWGRFAHVGNEYRYADGAWRSAATPVAQLRNIREIPRSLIALVANARRRTALRYSMGEHAPHQYIARLRPSDRVTEFGDFA